MKMPTPLPKQPRKLPKGTGKPGKIMPVPMPKKPRGRRKPTPFPGSSADMKPDTGRPVGRPIAVPMPKKPRRKKPAPGVSPYFPEQPRELPKGTGKPGKIVRAPMPKKPRRKKPTPKMPTGGKPVLFKGRR